MSQGSQRRKPTGKTGPISFGPDGLSRHPVEFPHAKPDIEMFIAHLFCVGKAGMRPQMTRYGAFSTLAPQRENSADLKVRTERGERWLELTEFAPLAEFAGRYENVSGRWSAEQLASLVLDLIHRKAHKNYGANVILVIYKTHETLFVPPPILRSLRKVLQDPPFESIYFLSPHDHECASVWEIWPGDAADEGPVISGGRVHVGFGASE